MHNPSTFAAQYANDDHLRVRIETHRRYGVGPGLEPAVDRALGLTRDEALLDVGTGPGDFPGRLRREGHQGRLVGVDLSEGMLERARATHPGVEFVRADAVALPFPNASFDAVAARHMLYHVPDIGAALAEAQRVLRPGGRVLAVTNADGYMREFWAAVAKALGDDPGFASFVAELTSPRYFHGHLDDLIGEAFGEVRLEIVQNALEFPAPAPVLAYFDSLRAGENFSDAQWARGRARLAQVLETRFAAGPWRVSKGVALFTATR